MSRASTQLAAANKKVVDGRDKPSHDDGESAARNDVDMTSHSRGMSRPSFRFRLPLSNQRAQGRPGACRTRGPACRLRISKRCTRAYRFGGSIPAFPAQWLYGLLRALPGERLFCLRRPQKAFASCELDASTATSEPHDFAVRFGRLRLSRLVRPSHPDRALVTMADAPHLAVRRIGLCR